MNDIEKNEIDLVKIFAGIYNYRKFILIFSLAITILGVVIAIISPVKYVSSTIFIPQSQENNASSISGVASLVGVNLGNSTYGKEIPLSMYPQVSQSPKFKRLLLSQIIDKKNNLSLKQYLIEVYKLKQLNTKNLSPLHVSKLEETCFNILSEMVVINVNQKDGFVTISSEMPNPEYSAYVSNYAREILQKIIIDDRIESAKQNLKFSQELLSEKKIVFDDIQAKLAYFSNSNLNSVNSFVINEKEKLEADFEIINAVVTELSKQVEQAKLQVSKDTPVFSTIKEAVIPNLRSSPKRTQIVIIFGLIGFVLSVLFTIIKDPFLEILNSIKSQ